MLPEAIRIGVPEERFFHLTPRKLRAYYKAYGDHLDEQRKRDDINNYNLGIYFAEAIASTVGNQLSGKHSKPHKYPDKPFSENKNNSEEELQRKRELFMSALKVKMTNFNLSQKEKQRNE